MSTEALFALLALAAGVILMSNAVIIVLTISRHRLWRETVQLSVTQIVAAAIEAAESRAEVGNTAAALNQARGSQQAMEERLRERAAMDAVARMTRDNELILRRLDEIVALVTATNRAVSERLAAIDEQLRNRSEPPGILDPVDGHLPNGKR